MATATYTCTVYKNNNGKYFQVGDLNVSGQVGWTATSTVGDIGFLAKIPHGAKIVDFYEYHTTGATAQALSFGFDKGIAAGGGGNLSCLISSGAQATMNRFTLANSPLAGNAPLQISVSDTYPIRFATLQAKIESGTTTTSLFVNFSLTYRFDGPDPH
jgi:hypothetical protein